MINIKQAEEIVSKHPELSWEGWDIVWIYEDPDGYTNKNGVFNNGKWCIKQVYSYKEDGWHIPNKILKGYDV